MVRIRIAYVIDNLGRDGTQTALMNLVAGLAKRGYEQRVYCLNDVVNPHVVRALTSSGAAVVVTGKAQLVTTTGLIKLFAGFKRWRPLIVQTFLPFGDIIGRTLARMAQVPVVVSSIRARNVEKRWWQFFLDRKTIRWADRVVFNSEQVIPFALAKEGVQPEQIVYIPNGVKIDLQNRKGCASRIRTELGVGPSDSVVGTVGRLHLQKGHRHLLAAFAGALGKVPDTVLLVIGDGPLRRELEGQATQLGIAGRVQFLGERADVPDLLACMDVYVQASMYEGMPNAVMEAMAAGKPVVATGVDGIKEIITDGETGWLVEPSDTKAMAERMVCALQDRTKAKRIGEAAAQLMSRDFSVDKMVLAHDRLYRELVASNKGFEADL